MWFHFNISFHFLYVIPLLNVIPLLYMIPLIYVIPHVYTHTHTGLPLAGPHRPGHRAGHRHRAHVQCRRPLLGAHRHRQLFTAEHLQ